MARRGQGETLVVTGYRELLRAVAKADKDTKRLVRTELLAVGEIVRHDAERRFDSYSVQSAHGYKVRVRQRGVLVEQSLRKTTGQNPDWGKLQMRKALLPALRRSEALALRRLNQGLDRIASHFNASK